MARILLVEDNEEYRNTLKKVLEDKDYEVHAVGDPISGIELVAINYYDLVISDLVMDIMNGIRFLTSIYKIQPNVHSIILTAEPDEQTELESLDINIDYYLSKDRSMSVILRYVEEVLSGVHDKNRGERLFSKVEDIAINTASHEVLKKGQRIELAKKEYQILEYFLKNKNVVISRDDFIQAIWQDSIDDIDERVIDVHIKRLREKLKVISIMSVRGFGYKWNE